MKVTPEQAEAVFRRAYDETKDLKAASFAVARHALAFAEMRQPVGQVTKARKGALAALRNNVAPVAPISVLRGDSVVVPVLRAVAKFHGIPVYAITSHRQLKAYRLARQEAIWIFVAEFNLSMRLVGWATRRVDHVSARWAMRKMALRLAREPGLRERLVAMATGVRRRMQSAPAMVAERRAA